MLHLPEFSIVGGHEEIAFWLDQYNAAVDAGTIDPRPTWEIQAAEDAQRVASIVLEQIKPASSAVLITEGNCEQVTGQRFDWLVGVAHRLGVPVANPTGRKRVVDVEELRAALAKSARVIVEAPAADPITTVRRMLAERLNEGSHAPKA